MATYQVRGSTSHSVVYPYKTESGQSTQQWETYTTELEAQQRKAYIEYLQNNKLHDELREAAMDYKRRRAIEKAKRKVAKNIVSASTDTGADVSPEDNTHKTYREFAEKWLPIHARRNRISPNTYDSYVGCLKNHILPYFGHWVMSAITAEDIDNFVDHLTKKPCRGTKSYRKKPENVPTLSSGTVKKCYLVLTSGFGTAKKWRYITEIPETVTPVEKWKKRRAWEPPRVFSFLGEIEDDELLHLAVHIAFTCSLRAGETVGIETKTVDFHDRSLWITQEVQRVSDKSLEELPGNEIIRIFPKQIHTAKSSMILKGPKTEGSHRKQYLTTPLLQEIKQRLETIESNKAFFGKEYQDYDLLLCQPNGRPIDPKSLDGPFKKQQAALHIEDPIEFQGLRKSGQMHKVRLSKNNYQLVAENSGQSPGVLMSNYNEALDCEKRALAMMVETSFYLREAGEKIVQDENETDVILQKLRENPELSKQIMQILTANALNAQQDIVFKN